MILDMLELKLLKSRQVSISVARTIMGEYSLVIPFALRMEVDTADASLNLIEANVVEPFEAGTGDRSNPVIRHEEILFPPHKNMFALRKVAVCKIGPLGLFRKRFPSRKSGPVVYVCLFVRTPFFITSLKSVLGSNYFTFKESGQGRMILGEALNAQIAAQVGFSHVHVLNLHVNIIHLAVRLLCADKSTSGAEKGRRMIW